MSQHSFGAQWYDSGGTQGAAKRIRVKFQAAEIRKSGNPEIGFSDFLKYSFKHFYIYIFENNIFIKPR